MKGVDKSEKRVQIIAPRFDIGTNKLSKIDALEDIQLLEFVCNYLS
jgi:hypothetical protein